MLMMQTMTTMLPTTNRWSLLTSMFGYASKSVRLGGSHTARTLLSSKLRSVDAFVAAHKSSPSPVGMAIKVRHLLRSLGDATKLEDSDRVRFAEPEGIICLICLQTCLRLRKHPIAPAASSGSMNSAFCISKVLLSILSTNRTAERDFFPRGGSNFRIPCTLENQWRGRRPPGSSRRQAEKRRR